MGAFPKMTPEEAVALIPDGATVSFSGFSPAGGAKVIPRALAARAKALHAKGEPMRVRVLSGASSGNAIDDELAEAEAISWRAPYMSGGSLRRQINKQEVEYVEMHLSNVSQTILYGFVGKIDFAVVEATEITPDGRVFLSTSIGASPTFLQYADKVIIELNRRHSMRLREMADIVVIPPPPHRSPIPIYDPMTKIGWPYAPVDPKKVVAIVENDEPDHVRNFNQQDGASEKIAEHVVRFLMDEMRAGRIPQEFLPLQAGVGNVANGVLASLGANPDIPTFRMYSEVFQDACVDLMEQGKLTGASATSLTVTTETLRRMYDNLDFFIPKIVLRPSELSNHSGVIRRLGVIAMNTAIEFDIYGNVNSSHICGSQVMNGIGGSGEFTRNSYLSIMMCPSVAKGGKISAVVPMVPHVDNNEHSVQVLATEQGLADLRGLGPLQRARKIIDTCAHPAYRDYLHKYIERANSGHIPHDLATCFELHRNLMEQGAMLPGVEIPEA